jgi:hypothetical protein
MTVKKMGRILIPALVLALVASGAAQGDLVTNGGFESTTNGLGQLGYPTYASGYTQVTGWTSADGAYNFVLNPTTVSNPGSYSNQFSGNLELWGPGNGQSNGLGASPNGGNFLAADGAYNPGAISQTITGLTPGATYQVGFYWAGAQEAGPSWVGETTEQWQVSFGSQTQSTAVVNNAAQGFTGWQYQTFNFTADGTSDVLSFLASGGPGGEPPFVLLDGVSVNAVPEPTGISLMVIGTLCLGVVVGLRRRALAMTAAA